jgi:hypothetical protein
LFALLGIGDNLVDLALGLFQLAFVLLMKPFVLRGLVKTIRLALADGSS